MQWDAIANALGLGQGGAVRSAMDEVWASLRLDQLTSPTPGHQRVAFTIAFVSLAAKMAKADGVAVEIEAHTFDMIFAVPERERANVRRVYDVAARDIAGYENYAAEIARLLKEEPRMLRDVFDCLFHVAAADGVLHAREDQFLRKVAEIFEIGAEDLETIYRTFVRDPGSPYEILGVRPDISDAELRTHHRKLVLEHHPDRMIARGVPPEFWAAADRKLAVLNAAYDLVLKERGRKPSGVAGKGQEP